MEQKRKRQQASSITLDQKERTSEHDERLLPFLFAAMEACCIDAILIGLASINFLGSSEAIVPLWIPFILLEVSCWFAYKAENSKISHQQSFSTNTFSDVSLALVTAGLILLGLAWLSKFDLYQTLIVSIFFLCLCLRGNFLTRRRIDSSYATKTFRLGIVITVLVVLLQAIRTAMHITFHDDFTLLLLLLLLVSLWLTTHALATVTYLNHFDRQTNQKNTYATGKRIVLLTTISTSFLLIIVAFIVSSFINPSLLLDAQAPLQKAYELVTSFIAHILTLIATPVVWLLSLLHFQTPQPIRSSQFSRGHGKPPPQLQLTPPANHHTLNNSSLATLSILQEVFTFIFPILVAIIILFLIRRWLVHQKKQKGLIQKDIHESLWSWSLFWSQFKALFLTLSSRLLSLFIKSEGEVSDHTDIEKIEGRMVSPTVRSMQEVYRALQKRATSLGYPRKRDETTYEFKERLSKQFPAITAHLAAITEAYTLARYSGTSPNETEVEQARKEWIELEKRWE